MSVPSLRLVEAPLPDRRPETAVAVLAAAEMALYPSLPHPASLAIAALLVAAGAVASLRRAHGAAALAILCAGTSVAAAVPGIASRYPLSLGLAFAASVPVALALQGRRGLAWIRAGRWDRRIAAWTAVLVAIAAAAIAAGAALYRHRPPHVPALSQALPPVALAGGIVAWSAVNAALEELAFRGALLHALEGGLGTPAAIGLQGVAFGVMHLPVAPGRWAGAALVAAFAVALALLRRRSGGLLAPWVAHAAADVVMLAVRLSG